jgi:hypothetical protein
MYILAAPMARFISLSWLSGHVPVISWLMGDGFNPWLSGQSGVLYPVYPVAMLLAKGIGREHLLLDLTALLDLSLVAYFIYGSPLFRKASAPLRLTLAILFVVQPSAVILGQNWCYFLNSYVWCVISMGNLLAWQRWPSKTRFGWWTLGSLVVLFAAINAQMFPFFMVICVLPAALAFRPRWRRRQVGFGLLLAMLLMPAFACIWWASQNGNPAWMAGRDSMDTVLAFGQNLATVLKGALAGNLAGSSFKIWRGVSSWGSGIFYIAPAALLGLVLSRPRDRRIWGFTWLVLLLLLGIATLPALKWLFLGPFARFRWTWKFSIFIPSLVLASIAAGRPEKRPRLWMPVLLISVFMSCWISSRGLAVDFFPSQRTVSPMGIHGLLDPALELKARLAMKPGERLVPVGRMASMDQPVPLAWLAMIGNAPSLVDLPSMAVYDPLEPADSARLRGGLSTPWREALPDGMDGALFKQVDAYLGPQGAAVYLFKERPRFTDPIAQEFRLSNGDVVYGVRSQCWQPQASLASGRTAPDPTIWGDWPVPEQDRMRLATARALTLFLDPGPSAGTRSAMRLHSEQFSGPWVLRFQPLGDLGPWVGLWYTMLLFLFIGAWLRKHPQLDGVGLPAPGVLAARVQTLRWGRLCLIAAGIFLLFRLPILLGPQPISDAVFSYPKQALTMVGQHLAPYRQVPFEYPPLALVPMLLSALWAGASIWLFRLGFAAQMFLVDAILLAAILLATYRQVRKESPGREVAATLGAGAIYLCATQPLGCLLYDRLDLPVAAFLAIPMLFRFSGIVRRSWYLGLIIGFGFWFKLVPVLALAPLALWEWHQGAGRPAWRRLAPLLGGSALAFLGIGVLARWAFGPSLWSFLSYHLGRPIEFGSLWASLDYTLSGGSLHPVFEHGGWHFRTGLLPIWKILSTALTGMGLFATLGLGYRALARMNATQVCALVGLGSVLCFVTFGKVFSPQYLLWIAPILPLLLWSGSPTRGLVLILGSCLGAVAVTGIYFPSWHYAMVRMDGSIWSLVILRNGLCLSALISVWKHLRMASGRKAVDGFEP